jgi:DNA-directed RNA polymerase subunit beta
MATPSQRRLQTTSIRRFGSGQETLELPSLTELQTKSYEFFLQEDLAPEKRKNLGLEAVLREIFPIESYDKQVSLEYLRYELGKPRYTPTECRQLRLTYGKPMKVWLRLNREQPIEEEVYLGDIPIMLGGGEFIINGAERVVVSQLHRSPGLDFVEELEATSDRKLPSCRVIPERGSWIEINVTKKDTLSVRIDQSGKFSVMTLLRAMAPNLGTDSELLRTFYPTIVEKITDGRSVGKIEGKISVDDLVYPSKSERAGEVIIEAGQKISKNIAEIICTSGIKKLEVMESPKTPHIVNSLAEDNTSSHEEALLRIFQRLRPGNPPQLEKAKALFHEKFFDVNRYRLGRVGRFRINRKLNLGVAEEEMTMRPEDLIAAIRYMIDLFDPESGAQYDDIDHLGNRRLRTIDELAADELRKGFLKLSRTVKERMNAKEVDEMSPRSLVHRLLLWSR